MVEKWCTKGNGASASRPMEEEVYWSQFKSLRFFISLSSHSLTHLTIPKKFSENVGENLPKMAVLKGSGGDEWKVQLCRSKVNDTFMFRDGWKEFVKAHDLKENDLLMFKYKRDSCFRVLVFDGNNSCENAGSYFIRKPSSEKATGDGGCLPKRKARKRKSAIENLDDEAGSDCNVPNRRPPSAAEIQRVVQMAIKASTSDSFYVILKAGHVSQYYRMGIPAAWQKRYLERKHQFIELHMNNKRWTVRLNVLTHSYGGILVSGWSNFVDDNSVKESDVCLFKPRSLHKPVSLDVRVFRAGGAEAVDQRSRKRSSI